MAAGSTPNSSEKLRQITTLKATSLPSPGRAERNGYISTICVTRRKLQQEIRDNVADLSKVQNAVATERQSLTEIIKFLQARPENKVYIGGFDGKSKEL